MEIDQSREDRARRLQHQNQFDAHAGMREYLEFTFPLERRVLYVGMATELVHPLAMASAHHTDAVDPLYRFTKPEPGAEADEDARFGEGDPYLATRDLQRSASSLGDFLGDKVETFIDAENNMSLVLEWQNQKRTYRLFSETLSSFFADRDTMYPIILMHRTFPTPSDWVTLLSHLQVGGVLYTTGFGWNKFLYPNAGYDSYDRIQSSPLPLFFPPESIGLRQVDVPKKGCVAYEKFDEPDPKLIEGVLQLGQEFDWYASFWGGKIEKYLHEQRGAIVTSERLIAGLLTFLGMNKKEEMSKLFSQIKAFTPAQIREFLLREILERVKVSQNNKGRTLTPIEMTH